MPSLNRPQRWILALTRALLIRKDESPSINLQSAVVDSTSSCERLANSAVVDKTPGVLHGQMLEPMVAH